MIDYDSLLNSVKEVLLEDLWEDYDLESIVRNASLCWDDTAVMVKSSDFTFIFDLVSYDCVSVSTNDLNDDEDLE